MQNVTDNLLHNLHSWRFWLVFILFFELLAFCFSCLYQGVFVEVCLLKFLDGTLALAFFTCKLVAVADQTVSFDRLLPQDFSLRTIDKIALGIPHEVSFKSLGTHLLGSHLQYSRLCYIRSVLLDLYNLCIG